LFCNGFKLKFLWKNKKMKEVKVLVLAGNGINCEYETAHAFKLVGGRPEIVYLYELLEGEKNLENYQILCFPGGFLDGDHLGAAKACAHRFLHARIRKTGKRLWDELLRFIQEGKLILGICNGFQLLVKMGLIPALDLRYGLQQASFTFNDSGHFEDRWVWLRVNPLSNCVFTQGLEGIYLPVRHGEGKFVTQNEGVLRDLFERNQVVLQYAKEDFTPTMEYPFNPNGSYGAIAGICDPTGRIFGIMPHPEAFLHFTNHPRWRREKIGELGEGVALFHNAVQYVRKNL